MIEKFTTGSFFTNSYIISNKEKECVIIDPALNYEKVANYIKNKYTVKAIILTHGHVDHVDGLNYFLDLPIYILKDEVDVLFDTNESLYFMINRVSPFNESMLNLIKLNDNDEFKLIGHNFKVIKTPGHTKGSACYLMDNEILFSGDTLFNYSIGRTDFPTGNMDEMKESLKKIAKLNKDIKVYPGHNDETTIGFEIKNNPFLI